jgi:hypothetical protein
MMVIDSGNKDLTINPQEFSILSIISHSGKSLDLKSRLKLLLYLSDQELGDKYTIYSYKKGNVGPEPKKMRKHLKSLSDKGIITIKTVRTFGGDKRYKYYINEKYFDLVSDILKREGKDIEKLHGMIGDAYDQYGDIPISNLMKIVRENHPEYFRNNTHVWH